MQDSTDNAVVWIFWEIYVPIQFLYMNFAIIVLWCLEVAVDTNLCISKVIKIWICMSWFPKVLGCNFPCIVITVNTYLYVIKFNAYLQTFFILYLVTQFNIGNIYVPFIFLKSIYPTDRFT